jgi:hypothetical protein
LKVPNAKTPACSAVILIKLLLYIQHPVPGKKGIKLLQR